MAWHSHTNTVSQLVTRSFFFLSLSLFLSVVVVVVVVEQSTGRSPSVFVRRGATATRSITEGECTTSLANSRWTRYPTHTATHIHTHTHGCREKCERKAKGAPGPPI
jgi:hypothetical protein